MQRLTGEKRMRRGEAKKRRGERENGLLRLHLHTTHTQTPSALSDDGAHFERHARTDASVQWSEVVFLGDVQPGQVRSGGLFKDKCKSGLDAAGRPFGPGCGHLLSYEDDPPAAGGGWARARARAGTGAPCCCLPRRERESGVWEQCRSRMSRVWM